MASRVEEIILKALEKSPAGVVSDALAQEVGVEHQEVVGAAKSLESDGYIVSSMNTKPMWKLSEEAMQITASGSPEYNLWQLLASGEMSQTDIQANMGNEATVVAMSNGMKSKWFKLNKKDGAVFLSRNPAVTDVKDSTRDALLRARAGDNVDPKETEALKKRKLASLESMKVFTYTKGANYAPARKAKAVGDLTRQMLLDGSWKTAQFKEYNFEAPPGEIPIGQLHPLLKVRQELREIFMELGFQEMATQHWAEASFWNFDSLFIPQCHPARDIQDTFFLSKPSTTKLGERDLVAKVKAEYERTFHHEWKEEEASLNVLRTHTTGTSAYTLYRLAQNAEKLPDGTVKVRPGRYYSIDRVFRNEEMDRTHLCEFHQVEGFVVDRNISLANMMHTFDLFFRRIGIEKLRFKPAFNPYTEPSMEIFGFHTGLNKWIEVGNSGLFRPELLGPLGLDEGLRVMAWGLSVERPTMIKYGINSIHELFGHRVDINFIKRAAIARY